MRAMRFWFVVLALGASALGLAATGKQHNVIIFVADGLRGSVVDARLTPNLDAIRREGVAFPNSHALFPTVTTANGSAIATGHYLGDTGNFANTIFTGFQTPLASGETSPTPFLEDDVVLGAIDKQFGNDYLGEQTLLAAARSAGFSTAAIGKLGPSLIQDHTNRSGSATIVLDDRSGIVNDKTGALEGIQVTDDLAQRMQRLGLALTPPATDKPNRAQQQYFLDSATQVILPMFKERAKPFVMVLWMRDPDTSQHNQLDSRYAMVPGINGSTSLDAIGNVDRNVGDLRAALKALGLEKDTDLFVTSDHGFSTISKQSDSSHAAKCHYDDVPDGHLPPGFLALDLSNALDTPLRDPDAGMAEIDRQSACDSGAGTAAKPGATLARHPRLGDGAIGHDANHPDIMVAAGAGSALIYFTSPAGRSSARLIVNFLLMQDYIGGVFVDAALEPLPGTIPMRAVGLQGSARTPRPDIVVSFRSFSTGCDEPLRCGGEVADSLLNQGQGMHGAFSRADTFNFMAAVGPDFKTHFSDDAPVSNADIAPTLAHVLRIAQSSHGTNVGRILTEALPGGLIPAYATHTCRYASIDLGRWPNITQPPLTRVQPVLQLQTVGSTRYFDAAGIAGRTLGIDSDGQQCAP